jgi:hypothetical protein
LNSTQQAAWIGSPSGTRGDPLAELFTRNTDNSPKTNDRELLGSEHLEDLRAAKSEKFSNLDRLEE